VLGANTFADVRSSSGGYDPAQRHARLQVHRLLGRLNVGEHWAVCRSQVSQSGSIRTVMSGRNTGNKDNEADMDVASTDTRSSISCKLYRVEHKRRIILSSFALEVNKTQHLGPESLQWRALKIRMRLECVRCLAEVMRMDVREDFGARPEA